MVSHNQLIGILGVRKQPSDNLVNQPALLRAIYLYKWSVFRMILFRLWSNNGSSVPLQSEVLWLTHIGKVQDILFSMQRQLAIVHHERPRRGKIAAYCQEELVAKILRAVTGLWINHSFARTCLREALRRAKSRG